MVLKLLIFIYTAWIILILLITTFQHYGQGRVAFIIGFLQPLLLLRSSLASIRLPHIVWSRMMHLIKLVSSVSIFSTCENLHRLLPHLEGKLFSNYLLPLCNINAWALCVHYTLVQNFIHFHTTDCLSLAAGRPSKGESQVQRGRWCETLIPIDWNRPTRGGSGVAVSERCTIFNLESRSMVSSFPTWRLDRASH